MKVRITQVLPVYPTHVHIQWSVEDRESALSDLEVLRSQSPSGPFEIVAVLERSENCYSDAEPNLLGLNRNYWYMVKANSRLTDSEFALSEPKTYEYELKGHRANMVRKARRDLKIQLERLNGVPIIILKRRTFGERCGECFNPLTNDVMYSHCNTCFGTTYVGGYHDPVYTYGKLDPVVIQESISASGPSQSAITGLTITEFPEVDVNDLVVECRTNRRFKVKQKMQSEGSRIVVHQDLQVSELSRSAVEYDIPVRLVE